MKQFISLMMLVMVLASCGEAATTPVVETPTTETEISTEIDAAADTTIDALDAELEAVEDEQAFEEAEVEAEIAAVSGEELEVVKIQIVYTNPKQEVNADIEYSLDSEGKIASIDITDSNYDITRHITDGNLDVLIGKSLDEVEDTYIAGGSLTIPEVKKALIASA